MAMAPEASATAESSSSAPSTSKHRPYQDQRQKQSRNQQCLRPSQDYHQTPNNYHHHRQQQRQHYCQQNASSSKQQQQEEQKRPASASSSTFSSPKLTLRESLRESFRDLHMPRILSNLWKPASEISLVLEAMRYGSSPTYLLTHEPPPKTAPTTGRPSCTSKSTGNLAPKKRKRRKAIVTWQNYSPHHINKQIRY
ncbi:unnamed protein product, partial [Gongylonema pulchrum]|uniref:Uncharacterized protein n=1 Tax=Gongylonema pulchrum TaxID=637853 RepID=A0A183DA01_9BILA